ncbi:hypothetical protein RF11_14277 [Thelohanellus kitauei]|uniref:Uncharacterized protein n=1 Tax=Thelohanellus kitauei TaxID=669202 RepID=A0A0C2JG29_THEKT|nr:hypothetical protein RF11_14277 [Thelohanellus kitauei]
MDENYLVINLMRYNPHTFVDIKCKSQNSGNNITIGDCEIEMREMKQRSKILVTGELVLNKNTKYVFDEGQKIEFTLSKKTDRFIIFFNYLEITFENYIQINYVFPAKDGWCINASSPEMQYVCGFNDEMILVQDESSCCILWNFIRFIGIMILGLSIIFFPAKKVKKLLPKEMVKKILEKYQNRK